MVIGFSDVTVWHAHIYLTTNFHVMPNGCAFNEACANQVYSPLKRRARRQKSSRMRRDEVTTRRSKREMVGVILHCYHILGTSSNKNQREDIFWRRGGMLPLSTGCVQLNDGN